METLENKGNRTCYVSYLIRGNSSYTGHFKLSKIGTIIQQQNDSQRTSFCYYYSQNKTKSWKLNNYHSLNTWGEID